MSKEYRGYIIHMLLPVGLDSGKLTRAQHEMDLWVDHLGGGYTIEGPIPFTDDGGRQ